MVGVGGAQSKPESAGSGGHEPDVARPQIRASFVKSVLASMEELGSADRERVRGHLSPELLGAVGAASKFEWLDGEAMIEIDIALAEAFGEAGVVDFWRRFARTSTRVPLLRPLADNAIRLFASPRGVFKALPRSWKMMTRGFGRVRLSRSEGEKQLSVRMIDVPPLSRPDLFNLGQQGSYQGVLELVGAEGTVSADSSRIPEGIYEYDIRWS